MNKKLKQVLKIIEKDFGEGTLKSLTDLQQDKPLRTISTGSISLDKALGTGGLPRGRIVEIYGPPGSGKTALSLSTVAEAQKQGGIGIIVDTEYGLNPYFAELLGVDLSKLYIHQQNYGEQSLELVDKLAKENVADVIVVDSVSGLLPKESLEVEMGGEGYGMQQAKLMSQALRKLATSIGKSKSILIFVNQIRTKPVMFGNPNVTSGGKALQFYASVRLEVRNVKMFEDKTGHVTRIKVVKNKCGLPYGVAEYDLVYARGINKKKELVNMAISQDLIKKTGAWYIFDENRKYQGIDNIELTEEEYAELRSKLK